MTTAYELDIQTHCPQAEIVYDLSHVVAKYGRKVIDRVCVERQWCEWAEQSGIAPLNTFAQRLKGYLHGILARCQHRLNTSIVEGINDPIKVIKRRAYGYRDQEYFFFKIRAAFTGNAQ